MDANRIDRLKLFIGGVIIFAAGMIMLPDWVKLLASLWRIVLVVILSGGICLVLAYVTGHIMKHIRKRQPFANKDHTSF